MDTELRFFPEAASTMAGEVDALYLFLVGVTIFFTVLIAGLILVFSIQYRRGSNAPRPKMRGGYWMEISWLIFPLPILMTMFYWGANVYFRMYRIPEDTMQVDVVGKQWMWKFQHPNGKREIDHLHVPTGRPVKLRMISQDVIHSLYLPAFRIKQDVLPGRYTQIWFEATKPGEYHLFCAEYCGAHHSLMRGSVIVMTPEDYQAWLSSTDNTESMAVTGQKLFEQYRCNSCHRPGENSRGPALENLFAHGVQLASGQVVVADEDYIRESILDPRAKVVQGYQPIMPTYQGQISEEGIYQIIAYIKSLSEAPTAPEGVQQ